MPIVKKGSKRVATKKAANKKVARKKVSKTTAAKTTSAKRTTAVRKRAAVVGPEKKLTEYRQKRDFTVTAEPAGGLLKRGSKLAFVIQKHAASHLHFDLRLELDGVMKSWAVPRGPSLDPSVKRLAMQVEDHPIEYNTFEGIIPKGEYGGGTVMLWDRGTYTYGGEADVEPVEGLRRGYARGDLKFILSGHRLQGSWVLVRTHGADPNKPSWLLIKHRDESARPGSDVVAEEQTSVTTGRTMDEIAAGRSRVWNSNHIPETKPDRPRPGARRVAASKQTGAGRR